MKEYLKEESVCKNQKWLKMKYLKYKEVHVSWHFTLEKKRLIKSIYELTIKYEAKHNCSFCLKREDNNTTIFLLERTA